MLSLHETDHSYMVLTTDHRPLTTFPGLYIHIPFCKTKCPYCDFYSVTDETLISGYLAALDTEARLYRDQFPAFDSLFLGGGTPSLLTGPQLSRVDGDVATAFYVCPGQ